MSQALPIGLLPYAFGRPLSTYRNPGSMLEVAGVFLIVAAIGFVGMESIRLSFQYTASSGWRWTGWQGLSVYHWVMPFGDHDKKLMLARLGLIAVGFVLAISGYSIVRGRRSDEWTGFVLAVLCGSASLPLGNMAWHTGMNFAHPVALYSSIVPPFGAPAPGPVGHMPVTVPVLQFLSILMEVFLLCAGAWILGRRLLRAR